MYGTGTIFAPATGIGGAISIIRVSGETAIEICDKIFRSPKSKKLSTQKGFSIHFGNIVTSEGEIIDEVLVSIFIAPNSYTGENMVEISCHASEYIISSISQQLSINGARPATAGEFTMRAFVNGKMDLSQAEAVADLIASSSRLSHSVAMNQMKGNFSNELSGLREKLIELSSLLELELDFSEEDVEFADRTKLNVILQEIIDKIDSLAASFALGNVIKNGIPVSIVGSPNVGKSTILNRLLNEERAIVSDIAGTTRDVIEDSVKINDVEFRFIDTAGIRKTEDKLESIGIERTFESVNKSSIVIFVSDFTTSAYEISKQINELNLRYDQKLVIVLNKSDNYDKSSIPSFISELKDIYKNNYVISISALNSEDIEKLTESLYSIFTENYNSYNTDSIVTNSRHYDSLNSAKQHTYSAQKALKDNVSADMVSEDIRAVSYYIGEITGDITNDDILSSIFSKFCIGK